MAILERALLQLFTRLLRLYPRQFRQDFGVEMNTVFSDALAAARQDGLWAVLSLCSRELSTLPRTLVHEHWQLGRKKEARMESHMRFTSAPQSAQPDAGGQAPARSWREVLLAALPFLVILLVDMLPKMLVMSGLLTWEDLPMQALNIFLGVLGGAASLACLFLAWRQKWPDWSAVWYPFFLLPLMLLAGWLLSLLIGALNSQDVLWYTIIPLTLAVLLYAVTRLNQLRGLLSALPVIYLLWLPNMEFVPDAIEVAIKLPSTALICLAIAFLLHRRDWRRGLYAVLGMNLLVGALYAYAGIYHGGTLPFVAPGPNLLEVLRSLVPQYLATSAILLGPLFAWKFRQAGRATNRAGWVGYHLALAGLLLVIIANLSAIMIGTTPPEMMNSIINGTVLTVEIVLGIGVYLFGLFWVYRGAQPADGKAAWVQRILLILLPLAIPLTFFLPFITWKWPLTKLYGVPLLWEFPHALSLSLGLAWLALSVWVVTEGTETAGPSPAVTISPVISET